jgi:hypothetical protein
MAAAGISGWLDAIRQFLLETLRVVQKGPRWLSWVLTLLGLSAFSLIGWIGGRSTTTTNRTIASVTVRTVSQQTHLPWAVAGGLGFLTLVVLVAGLRLQMRILESGIQADTELHRKRALQKDPVIENQTIHLWELLEKPGLEKPVIANRHFVNCHIVGPTVVAIAGELTMIETVWSESAETVCIDSTDPNPKTGIIGLINCKFTKCRLEHIAVIGSPEVLARIRQIPAI